jgi:preprotein translocase subunit YajC
LLGIVQSWALQWAGSSLRDEAFVADSFLILAQAAGGNNSPLGMLPILAAMAAIMYFVMIRPQQKQLKEHRAMLAALRKGEEYVTTGGLVGRIHEVADRTVTLEIANGVRVRVLKTSVAGKFALEAPVTAAKVEDKKEEK